VPGLAAKPVIDIAVGIAALPQSSIYIPALEAPGYIYVPKVEAPLPSRRFLWKGTPLMHTYHFSLAEPDDPTMANPIIFRNYLRAHPDEVQRYQVLKRELAARCGLDVNAYVAGKTALVESVLAEAAEATYPSFGTDPVLPQCRVSMRSASSTYRK
jgi:GrpB-like predicted nucleotidyltransferase (UPF0157 family)